MAMLILVNGVPEGELWSRSGNHIKHTVFDFLAYGWPSVHGFFGSLDQVFHGQGPSRVSGHLKWTEPQIRRKR